tara:strand:+ start:414 stop:527 length:114 start_codon:yes stop_codon:yes gene_type:complete
VEEKSAPTDFGNDNSLIKNALLKIYFNKEANDAEPVV